MTVGANTYGTVAGIERLIGDIVDDRAFTILTTPSLAQAEAELDNVAGELNARLDGAGYSVPVVEVDYPAAYKYLQAANEYGASARLLATIPSHSYESAEEVEVTGTSRAQTYENLLKRALKMIDDKKLRAAMWLSPYDLFISGSQYDSDGNTKKPLFTRDRDNYPGTRILTDADETED
jgi:hypothetical protein